MPWNPPYVFIHTQQLLVVGSRKGVQFCVCVCKRVCKGGPRFCSILFQYIPFYSILFYKQTALPSINNDSRQLLWMCVAMKTGQITWSFQNSQQSFHIKIDAANICFVILCSLHMTCFIYVSHIFPIFHCFHYRKTLLFIVCDEQKEMSFCSNIYVHFQYHPGPWTVYLPSKSVVVHYFNSTPLSTLSVMVHNTMLSEIESVCVHGACTYFVVGWPVAQKRPIKERIWDTFHSKVPIGRAYL